MANDYTDFMRARGLSERSVHKNFYGLATFLKIVGSKNLLRLKKGDVTRTVAEIERSKYSPKTKQNILVVIKTFYKHFLGEDEFYSSRCAG